MKNQFLLLRDRRFFPLFVTQFTGAFNDNLLKNLLSVMVAYGVLSTGSWKPEVVVSMTAGFLIFPFLLFTPIAGDMADKYDKARLMRALKLLEFGIIGLAIIALFLKSVPLLLFVLFLFGLQAALFSPAKYSILPQQLETAELIGGNALINTGTYLAILAGTIIGGVLAGMYGGITLAAVTFILSGIAGYSTSRSIPPALPPSPDVKLKYNFLREIVEALKLARAQPEGVFTAIMGVSWFYFCGAVILSQFPNFTRHVLNTDTAVLSFLMAVFSVGIMLGGLLNNRLLKSEVNVKFVPFAGTGMALFMADLALSGGAWHRLPAGFGVFFSGFAGWKVVLDLLGISICGGLYVIPLKSLVQHRTFPERRARVMAASAVNDSIFILVSSILSALILAIGFSVNQLFLMVAVATFAVSVYLKGLR